jgi:hypothetical protein
MPAGGTPVALLERMTVRNGSFASHLAATLCAIALAAGCGRGGREEDSPAGIRDAAAIAVSDIADEDAAGARSAGTMPDEIYYDLTRFEWYRHGQPLMIDGTGFVPDGIPRAIRDRPLEKAGEYGGVAYYAAKGASQARIVLVPVFEGYWQAFVPQHLARDSAG